MTTHQISKKLADDVANGRRTKEEAKELFKRVQRFERSLELPTEVSAEDILKLLKSNTVIPLLPTKNTQKTPSSQTLEIFKYVVLFSHSEGRHWNELLTDIPLVQGDPQIDEMINILSASGFRDLKVIKIVWEA